MKVLTRREFKAKKQAIKDMKRLDIPTYFLNYNKLGGSNGRIL